MMQETLSTALQKALDAVESEGITGLREQLILWVLRNQFGIGAEDSYASILDDSTLFPGVEVDAIVVTTRRDLISPVYVIFEDRPQALKKRVASLAHALSASRAPEAELSKTNSQLRSLFEPASDRRISSDVSRLVLCLSMSTVSAAVSKSVIAAAAEIADVEVIDRRFIEALAEADMSPTESIPTVHVKAPPSTILDLGMRNTRAVITPVDAAQVASWEGIADRRLFDLNVRHALGLNRVRRSLDKALQDETAADEFIAYHNGITAVCRKFTVTESGLEIEGLSVVNGAQTVVAIHANAAALARGIRVLLKLVEAAPDTELASNIAIRSNTQNPVTSRNLRALDEVQARLESELADMGYVYLRRPNDQEAMGSRVIRNDDAAQLLCSVYARKPALAVKRQVLFEHPLYEEIFPTNIDPARVIFASMIRREVEERKAEVPAQYRKAWALTALTLVNMTAEAMRDDTAGSRLMLEPRDAVIDPAAARAVIAPFVQSACEALHARAEAYESKQMTDDFKVAFKQARTLSELAMQASRRYRRSARSVG